MWLKNLKHIEEAKNMNKLIILMIFSTFFSFTFAGSNRIVMEKKIVSEDYASIVESLDKKTEKTWVDYYYLSVSNYYLGHNNLAYLQGIKSLLLNPFSKNNVSNLHLYNNNLSSSDITSLRDLVFLKSFLLLAIIIFSILIIIFFKKKRLSLSLSFFQIILILFLFMYPSTAKYLNLSEIAIVSESNDKLIKLTPNKDSLAAKNLSAKEILFIGRSIDDWIYVENKNGDPGWVNKSYLSF